LAIPKKVLFCAAWIISLLASAAGPSATGISVAASIQRVAIIAQAGRFEPAEVHLVQGVPAILEFTRIVDSACMKAVRMPWLETAVDLPLNETVEIPVDTSMTGVFSYACAMDMVFGEVMIHGARHTPKTPTHE
jgi:plastocyanin domain-containing protein